MIFFDRKKGNIHLTADQGQLVPELEKVSFDSNVQIITSQGVTLLMDFLEYEEKEHFLQTDQSVHIFTDSYEATGNGMIIDLKDRTLVLFGDVKAQVPRKSSNAPISGTP
jgi:LPS export ABC transporter protein LptC